MTEEGASARVENLQIGDLVYDPFADRYVELIDILSRTVNGLDAADPCIKALSPVRIAASSLGANTPKRPILVSPKQTVLVQRPFRRNSRHTTFVNTRAIDLIDGSAVRQARDMVSFTYFALFTAFPQVFDVSGILMETLTPKVFSPSGQRLPKTTIPGALQKAQPDVC